MIKLSLLFSLRLCISMGLSFGLVLGFSMKAFSTAIPALQNVIRNEVIRVEQEVSACQKGDASVFIFQSPSLEQVPPEALFYHDFFVRVQPRVGFEVPGLVDVQVIPEIEMIWQRSFPEGWDTYFP